MLKYIHTVAHLYGLLVSVFSSIIREIFVRHVAFVFSGVIVWIIWESDTASFSVTLKLSKLFSGKLCSAKYETNFISVLVMSSLVTVASFVLLHNYTHYRMLSDDYHSLSTTI